MTQTYSPKDYNIFIALDVDSKSFCFTVNNHSDMNHSKKIPSDPEYFYNYMRNNYSRKRIICAYEAGPTGFHLYDYLTTRNIPCLVVPPTSIPKSPNEKVKTNRVDSKKLAQFLKAGTLKTIRVPEDEYRQLRQLIKVRENYAKLRKITKQRIKALLLSANLHSNINEAYKKWSNNYINELKKIPCLSAVRQSLDMLIEDLFYSRKQILAILSKLRTFCKNNKEIDQYRRYLQSIPGIGFIIAITIIAKIGNPKNLKNLQELGAFVGLVPCEKSTGEDINKGSITHTGNKVFRSLLIEAAWIAIRKDIRLRQFYYRIKHRHHPKVAAQKAITAVARKLTLIIYRVLKDQRMYVASMF